MAHVLWEWATPGNEVLHCAPRLRRRTPRRNWPSVAPRVFRGLKIVSPELLDFFFGKQVLALSLANQHIEWCKEIELGQAEKASGDFSHAKRSSDASMGLRKSEVPADLDWSQVSSQWEAALARLTCTARASPHGMGTSRPGGKKGFRCIRYTRYIICISYLIRNIYIYDMYFLYIYIYVCICSRPWTGEAGGLGGWFGFV